MSSAKNLRTELLKQDVPSTPNSSNYGIQFHKHQYKKFGAPPQITLTGLSLIILSPILIAIHLSVAKFVEIPIIQYGFVTLLIAFIINYTLIIRRYELVPFLPEQVYDNKLKKACVFGVAGILSSILWGWNGSGGMIFAIFWEKIRGKRMGSFALFYAIMIIGSLMIEKVQTIWKFTEFVPGILFGMVSSNLFNLKDSSTFTMTHQFIFLSSICIPMFFPISDLVYPTLLQWSVMIVTGATMLVTVTLTVKLMQSERSSIVMVIMSGLIMIVTSSFTGFFDYLGAVLILIGVALVCKKEYLELEYQF